MTDRTPEVTPQPQCSCSVRERDSGHRTDCVYASGEQFGQCGAEGHAADGVASVNTAKPAGDGALPMQSGSKKITAIAQQVSSPATVHSIMSEPKFITTSDEWNRMSAEAKAAVEEKLKAAQKLYDGELGKLFDERLKEIAAQQAGVVPGQSGRTEESPATVQPGSQPERQEQCTRCGNYVTDWVDPDWAKGRICLECESKYQPESEPTPQPAPAAGEKWQLFHELWGDAKAQASYNKQKWVGLQALLQQPCPRCADLERERDEIGKRLVADDSDSIVGACNCLTKSPAVQHHKRGCKYRLIQERDDVKAKCAELEHERDATWDALMETETTFPEPWFSVGTPSNFAKHIGKRLTDSQAKVGQLEKALRDIRVIGKMAYDRQYQYDQVGKMLEIANAVLAGGKK